MEFQLTEERLLEFATAELRCKILDSDPSHEHHAANTEYWQGILDGGPEVIVQYYYYHQGVEPQAAPTSKLSARVLPDVNRRLSRLQGNFSEDSYPVLLEVFAMDNQDCYSLFGQGNKSLEELEDLNSMLINGLYDDADLGIKQSNHGFWNITWVSDDFERTLDVEEVRDIIKKKAEQSTFYAANKKEVEASGFLDKDGMSRKYFDIGQEFEQFFRTFMREEDRTAIELAEKKSRDDLRARLDARRAEKEGL